VEGWLHTGAADVEEEQKIPNLPRAGGRSGAGGRPEPERRAGPQAGGRRQLLQLPVGGSTTVSITWITPFDAATSAATTVASFTITLPSTTRIVSV
jgi:hypothetical protein